MGQECSRIWNSPWTGSNQRRPDLPHYGAGEALCKPMLAAVANAVFDATGVRLRRVPFTAERMLAALKAQFRTSLRSNRQLQRGY
jgi:hypothetical protein